MKYMICGLKAECDFRHPTMTARAEKYRGEFTGAPDIIVPYCPNIAPLQANNPTLTEDDCEIITTAESFYNQLITRGGFMLHASAVVLDNSAYLFSAPSGTGKSTHTAQWLKLFPDAKILNDDKPAIMLGNLTACGTPWSGKSDLNLNLNVPLQGICVLERSERNFIQPLTTDEAIFALLNQTIRPADENRMDALLDHIDRIVGSVKIWRMGCNISLEAAQIAFDAMSRQ